MKTNPLRAIPGTLTFVLHGVLAVEKSMRYKEARRIKKLEFHAIPADAEIGKCRLLSQTSRQKVMTTDRQTDKQT